VKLTVPGANLTLGQLPVLHGLTTLSDILVAVISHTLLDWGNLALLNSVDLALLDRVGDVQYSHWAGTVTWESNFSERTLRFKILNDTMT